MSILRCPQWLRNSLCAEMAPQLLLAQMTSRRPQFRLVVSRLDHKLSQDTPTCLRILDECGSPAGTVRLERIPDGLNAEELAMFLRSPWRPAYPAAIVTHGARKSRGYGKRGPAKCEIFGYTL